MRQELSATKQEPTPKGKGVEVLPLVIADLEERVAYGVETYGEPLKADSGRDALVDAYQEALDLPMYLRQKIAERESLRERLEAILEDAKEWQEKDNFISEHEKGVYFGKIEAFETIIGILKSTHYL